VVSGPAEARAGAELARRLPETAGLRHWVAQRGLRELCALLRACSERAGVFVGCDSGPLHLAAAAGMRVVCLAGPQDERRTGPWPLARASESGGHRVVRSPDPPACAPCLARRCRHPEGPVCMRDIAPAAVLEAAR
jgi:ADP-heptose:LPS heptosyltransferase